MSAGQKMKARWTEAPVAFQQYDGPLMGMSFLEFRGAKQFFQKDCFFLWRWVAFGSGFCGVLLAVGHSFPYPQRLFCRQRLGDEKKVLRRTALPENSNGHQVSLLAAPAFIEQRFGCEAWYSLLPYSAVRNRRSGRWAVCVSGVQHFEAFARFLHGLK